MALRRSRRNSGSAGADYWPGFVDAMATLLLLLTFLLSIFVVVQYFASQEATSKDAALQKLQQQIAQLNNLLSLESKRSKKLRDDIDSMSATLSATKNENRRLQGKIGQDGKRSNADKTRIIALSSELGKQQTVSKNALARVEVLSQQLRALRRQLASLQSALDATESRDKESQLKIADLGKRLNVALAKKVQQLAQYRSDFFGRLRNVLGKRDNIQIVGDRFVFQAEVLFPSGSDEINVQGKAELEKLAGVLNSIEADIPDNVNWVLRIDGHTDIRPISTPKFPSNWELSSARAISVVKFLVSKGVPSNRLVAAGFGQFSPLSQGSTDGSLTQNRRIELKFTEK